MDSVLNSHPGPRKSWGKHRGRGKNKKREKERAMLRGKLSERKLAKSEEDREQKGSGKKETGKSGRRWESQGGDGKVREEAV